MTETVNNMTGTVYTFESILKEYELKEYEKIIIPMIQREYVQGDDNVIATEIRDNILNEFGTVISKTEGQETSGETIVLDYIYGIVRNKAIIPMDGQQRLTTLYLLYWYVAVRENIAQEKDKDCSFLKKFSYETRYVVRDFCEQLCGCLDNPGIFKKLDLEEINISDIIRNQVWFIPEWQNNPTVAGMLRMLDAIHQKFNETAKKKKLWKALNNIKFYFLTIDDDKLNTDEFYIKMNSRGKELSDFEIFKAEMEKKINACGQEKGKDIAAKIDGAWTEWIWKCRSNTDVHGDIDNMFLNYFHFVFDIICYKKGEFPEKWGDDIFEKFRVLFLNEKSEPNDCFKENISTLTDYFDCWCQIFEMPNYNKQGDFFESILPNKQSSNKKSENKDVINDMINLLKECLYHYQIKNKEEFTLQNLILLYACIIYLSYNRKNRKTEQEKKIDKEEFYCRFRIVNNLVRNSDSEINEARIEIESARRGKNDGKCSRMHNMLKVVEKIILYGKIGKKTANSFNEYQLQEERNKIDFIKHYPKRKTLLYELEDHELLQGQIGILGLKNLKYASCFCSLFEWDKEIISCALMAMGDYGFKINDHLIQYGSCSNSGNKKKEAWTTLFHRYKEGAYKNDEIQKVLVKLLKKIQETIKDGELQENDGELKKLDAELQKIIQDFQEDCKSEKNNKYSFQYYYVTYPAFRQGDYGRMWFPDKEKHPYSATVLVSEKQPGPNSYDPFLKEVFDRLQGQKVDVELTDYNYNKRNTEEYNQYLKYGDCVVASRNDKYVIFKVKSTSEETDGEQCVEFKKGSDVKKYVKLKETTIPQDEDGIDTVDRIALLLQNIKKYLSLSASNTKCSSEN